MSRHFGSTAVVAFCALLAACNSSTVSVQSRDAFASQFSSVVNDRVATLVGDTPDPALCLPSYDNAECIFVRGGREQPPCAASGCDSSFIAVEVRATLIERPEVRRVVEQESARYCTYIIGPAGTEHTPARVVLGCDAPGSPFRLFKEVRPTVCVFAIGPNDSRQIVERYAVRNGARSASAWCDATAR